MIALTEYMCRIERLKEKCKDNNVEAFLVCQEENLYYLTGKSCFPFERPFVLIIWADKEPTFLIPRLELEHLSVIEHINDFRTYYEYPTVKPQDWVTCLGNILGHVSRIGSDQYVRSEIFEEVLKLGETKVYNWVYEMRFTKSVSEQKMIIEVAEIAKASMVDFLSHIRYGDLALDSLEPGKKAFKQVCIDKKFELDFYASNFQSAAWPAPMSAKPHMIPNVLNKYERGPHVMILSYKLNGYAVELERTFFTEKPSAACRKIYMEMMDARALALSMCRPGMACSLVDKLVREHLVSAGYEENIIHRVGHGMGVSNHEGPFVSEGSETILEEGMIITIEPGMYFEELGGFRHSDTVLITSDGYKILTDVPTDMDYLTCSKGPSFKSKLKQSYLKRVLKKQLKA